MVSPTSALASTSVAKRVVQRWKSVPVRSEQRLCQGMAKNWQVLYWCVYHNRWGSLSIMVWDWISYQQRTPLVIFDVGPGGGNGVTAQCYIDSVLHPVVLPFMAAHPGMMFQQDNAPASVAQLDARPTGDLEVVGSTPAEVSNILSWRLIMKYFLRSFSPFRWFEKGSCQFLAKECAQYWLTAWRTKPAQ